VLLDSLQCRLGGQLTGPAALKGRVRSALQRLTFSLDQVGTRERASMRVQVRGPPLS